MWLVFLREELFIFPKWVKVNNLLLAPSVNKGEPAHHPGPPFGAKCQQGHYVPAPRGPGCEEQGARLWRGPSRGPGACAAQCLASSQTIAPQDQACFLEGGLESARGAQGTSP